MHKLPGSFAEPILELMCNVTHGLGQHQNMSQPCPLMTAPATSIAKTLSTPNTFHLDTEDG
jgi:hypothetical protein